MSARSAYVLFNATSGSLLREKMIGIRMPNRLLIIIL